MIFVFMILVFLLGVSAYAKTPDDASEWTIYITNDNCPDYTWGYTEEQTRQSFADIVRAHLDEMKRTDSEAAGNRDRYNMAVTQEALCFVERYPERKAELTQRIKEGRIYVSPYLCNSLWAFQSFEGAIRTFYPARRLEREWGIPFGIAEHIEEPSLPWGVASILSGCGIKWLSNPFYRYGSTFTELENPPVFIFEGPDGGRIRVVMDPWACVSSSYTQGGRLLREPNRIMEEWIPHYQELGDSYPARAILASGTHGDISPRSGDQVRGFADAIIDYNKGSGRHPKLVNAILPQFCAAIDEAHAQKPFLEVIRGCFGHSWDVWPVSLAKYVAGMRTGERSFLAAEALLTIASQVQPELKETTRSHRERGEWFLAMLSDHAWNGTDDNNKRHNAELRRSWGEELKQISGNLSQEGWNGLGVTESDHHLVIFNSLSIPRSDLVRMEVPTDVGVMGIDSQIVQEDGKHVLYFVSPEIPGFGLRQLSLKTGAADSLANSNLRATPTELESPYYHLVIDQETGGISSLIHKPTDAELVVQENVRTLCQMVYFNGEEHLVANVSSEVAASGPVLARLRVTGNIEGIEVTNLITVYAHLDRVDFDIHITKPATEKEERLCQVFPILQDGAMLRIETTGAVIRPKPQPEGDLLPGADTRRFAVQGFIDASLPDGAGVTIAPLDAFLLRLDLDPVTFEVLGNDQNYREVSKDQNGETEFLFRYSLRAHADGYNNAEAFNWSRSVATPLLAVKGDIGSSGAVGKYSIEIDTNRAIATCLKPAEENGYVMRLREVAGKSGPISVYVKGYRKVILTDLLERDIEELQVVDGEASFDLRPYGFAGLRLVPYEAGKSGGAETSNRFPNIRPMDRHDRQTARCLVLINRFGLISNFDEGASQIIEAIHDFAQERNGEIIDVDEIYFKHHGEHIRIDSYPNEKATKLAQEVKSYIVSREAQFVAIVGDETSIPMFEACGIYTDFFYSDLDENGIPKAAVARILGDPGAMIRQLRGQERPGSRALILCSEDTRIHLETRTFLKALTDRGNEVLFRSEEATDILPEFDLIIHFGHGTDTQISNRFGRPYVAEDNMPDLPLNPVVMVDGCATAPPGSKLLRAFMNKGCVAYLGSSASVSGMIPARYACELIIHFIDAYAAGPALPISEILRRARVDYMKAAQGLSESVLKLERGEEIEDMGELRTHLISLLEWHVFGSPFARFGSGSAKAVFTQSEILKDEVELSPGEDVTVKFELMNESDFPVLCIRAGWEKDISSQVEIEVLQNGLCLYQLNGDSHTVYQRIKDTCIGGYDDGTTYKAYFLVPLFRQIGENEVTIRLSASPRPVFMMPDSVVDIWASDIGSRYIKELDWNELPEPGSAEEPIAVVSRPEIERHASRQDI